MQTAREFDGDGIEAGTHFPILSSSLLMGLLHFLHLALPLLAYSRIKSAIRWGGFTRRDEGGRRVVCRTFFCSFWGEAKLREKGKKEQRFGRSQCGGIGERRKTAAPAHA